ncbi:Secreted hydrolase [Mycena chlorophos]|uniref:Secreted hydrolase n=1 Tax=Mycena chlorophos TaxID=658473 RepID=A0A8H6WMX5_MYCCL|nr:Secreted hydrolase [Mycena chlorophos]
MKTSPLLVFLSVSACCNAALLSGPGIGKRADPQGIDVSDYQTNIDWTTVKNNGVTFAYIKATEGTSFISDEFSSQYTGATNAGLIRGGYHFAHPDESSGATQASFFLAHGGGWSGDGITLPGALDIECKCRVVVEIVEPPINRGRFPDNPDGDECYDLTAAEMVSWIKDFSTGYHSATTRYPVIYTTTDWWTSCTGNSAAFAANSPLWIARYASSIGTLPAGWAYTTFWQYADSGSNPGDQDMFNGNAAGLKAIASG